MSGSVTTLMTEPIGGGEDFLRLFGEPGGELGLVDRDGLVKEPVGDGDRLVWRPPNLKSILPR